MREIDQLKARLAAQELTIERERRLRAEALVRAVVAVRAGEQAERTVEALRRQIAAMKAEAAGSIFKRAGE